MSTNPPTTAVDPPATPPEGANEPATSENVSLPEISTDLEEAQIVERLQAAAKRGKLPGFRAPGPRGGLFVVDAFGNPFDRDLEARVEGEGADRKLRFSTHLRWPLPLIFGVVLLLTIEPGRWMTDRMIPGEWGWIDTRWWYYPLLIIPMPFLWRSLIRKSYQSAMGHAREQIERIQSHLRG